MFGATRSSRRRPEVEDAELELMRYRALERLAAIGRPGSSTGSRRPSLPGQGSNRDPTDELEPAYVRVEQLGAP